MDMANALLMYMTGMHSKNSIITQQNLKDVLMIHQVFDYRTMPKPTPSALL